MESPIFDVPGVFTCTWNCDVKAVIGRWHTFAAPRVSGIVTRHVAEGAARGALTCVVDLSPATGTPAPADADWVRLHLPALLAEARIDAVVAVVPDAGPFAPTASNPWATPDLGVGVRVHLCHSLAEALSIGRDVLARSAA